MRWLPWSSGSKEDRDDSTSGHSSSEEKNNQKKPAPPTTTTTPTSASISAADSYYSSSSTTTIPALPNKRKYTDWNSILNATDWAQFTEPRNLIPTVLLTSGILFVVHVHRRFLRRFPEAVDIAPGYFRRRSLLGYVTSVGDGDNFRMFHTPGGRLAGWGWLPWKKVPTSKRELKDRTIHVRLAGIDAPELSHFGRPAQPYAHKAHAWLTSYLLNRRVRAYVHRLDQYQRVVATVYVRRFLDFPIPFRRRDVSYEMLKRGLATVYEAKMGAEFGGEERERQYREAERWAKEQWRGMWRAFKRNGGKDWESPRQYKNRMGVSLRSLGEDHTTVSSSPVSPVHSSPGRKK